MPKIKKTCAIDFTRKNPISLRLDPYLLRHFTVKADGAPGTRTRLMERSMRLAEEMEPICKAISAADPVIAHEMTHWAADGSRMSTSDAKMISYIKAAVAEKMAADNIG